MFDSKKKIKVATAEAVEQKLTSSQRQAISLNECLLYMYTGQVYLHTCEYIKCCCTGTSVLTVAHLVNICINFNLILKNFYTAYNLKDLFHNILPKRTISFVYAICLIYKL